MKLTNENKTHTNMYKLTSILDWNDVKIYVFIFHSLTSHVTRSQKKITENEDTNIYVQRQIDILMDTMKILSNPVKY